MRSFVAVELPDELRGSMSRILDELRPCGADVKWVRPEAVHLTLKFLGEIQPEQVEEIRLAVQEVAGRHGPFKMEARGLGCFPRLEQPRVVWLGLEGEKWKLEALQREVETALTELGFPKEERPFRPHLTLGRVRSPKARLALVQRIKNLEGIQGGELVVGSVALFKSQLLPSGARYTKLWEERLSLPGTQNTLSGPGSV